jgi:uncharacterized protein
VVTFEDLSEGMTVSGKVKNVVDFGAFVDLGIKETALLHISEMSDTFVKDPMDAMKVGDLKEFRIIGLDRDRRRISLSLKSEGARAAQNGNPAPRDGASRDGARPTEQRRDEGRPAGPGGKRVLVAKRDGFAPGGVQQRPAPARGPAVADRPRGGRPEAEDDGTMYNPFAEAMKKMQEKKGKK